MYTKEKYPWALLNKHCFYPLTNICKESNEVTFAMSIGQVYAMAGAGENHNRITVNLAFHLRSAARGKICGVFISDMKLRIEQNNVFYYPDVMLACDPDDSAPFYKQSPCLIVEVSSPATEATDRREKLIAYLALPSLRYYLLVSQEQRQVEYYSRNAQNQWCYALLAGNESLDVVCADVNAHLSLDDIYEDVSMES
jgi:Uma2 family endonuclease